MRVAVTVCAVAVVAAHGTRVGAVPSISDAGRAALSAVLKSAVESGRIPGIVALVTNAERELYVEAVGRADITRSRPMRADAIFRIASMTKPITTAAAMML